MNVKKVLNIDIMKNASSAPSSSLYSDLLLTSAKASTKYTGVYDSTALEEKLDDMVKFANDSIPLNMSGAKLVNDSYGNSLLSIGNNDKVQSFTNYGFSNDSLNWMLWTVLYNDSWVFKRAIDKPAQDQVNAGFTLLGSSDKFDKVYKDFKKVKTELINILQWGALYGGSIGVMTVKSISYNEMQKPFNMKKLNEKSIIKIYAVDRWYGVAPSDELVTDMSSLDFGKPKYYNVTFPDGKTYKIHHSFVLRYEHRVAPQLIKRGQLQGWGYAEGAHIINELSRDDKLKASIQSLVDKSLIEVIKMSGMRGVFMGADKNNEQQLRKRLEMVNWGRNFNSLTFLDKDDEYSQNTFSGLSGLADLLQQNMWLISAALEMQGVLFGDLKNGFANDADALERYDDTIQGRCEAYYKPVLAKLLNVLYHKYDIQDEVDFEFDSLLKKKQDEKRMEGLKDFVDLVDKMHGSGFLTTVQAAKAINKFTSKGTIDFMYDEQIFKQLEDDMSNEMEDIDIDEVEEETEQPKKKGLFGRNK